MTATQSTAPTPTVDPAPPSIEFADLTMLLAASSALNGWFSALANPEDVNPAGLIGTMRDAGLIDMTGDAEGGRIVMQQTEAFLGAIVRAAKALGYDPEQAGDGEALPQ